MAGSINKATVIGTLGKDPEVRQVGDTRVASLSLATNETWKDKSTGEKKEKTEWHRITVWGDGLCGVLEKYSSKGDRLYIEGQLETRKWQDKDGQDRYTTEIVVRAPRGQVVLLGSRSNAGASEERSQASKTSSSSLADEYRGTGASKRSIAADLSDDIPF
jgi:single-strand DNA-binding protein